MARPLVAAATSAATATASALSLVLAAFGGGEGVAASAALGSVRIVDLEAAARQRIVEVDGSAVQVFNARQIDDDLHAEDLEHLVLGRDRLVLDLHAVRKPRAAAARDEDAHALICAAVLLHDGLDLGSRFLAQRYHSLGVPPAFKSRDGSNPCQFRCCGRSRDSGFPQNYRRRFLGA